MRLERRAVNHVDWRLEETGDILFEAHVIVDRPFGPGLELHQYIEVAARPAIATRNRAEHSSMRHAMRAQGALMTAKSGKGILHVHLQNIYPYALRPRTSAVLVTRKLSV